MTALSGIESLELIESDVMTLLELCAQIVTAVAKVDGRGVVPAHAAHFLQLLAKIQDDLLAHVHTLAAHGSTLHLDLAPHRAAVDALRARVDSVQTQLRLAEPR